MCFIQLNKQFLPLINKNISVSPGSRQSNQLLCETNKKGYSPFQERGLCEKSFQPLCSQLTTGPLQQSGGIVNIFVNIMLIYQESNLLWRVKITIKCFHFVHENHCYYTLTFHFIRHTCSLLTNADTQSASHMTETQFSHADMPQDDLL